MRVTFLLTSLLLTTVALGQQIDPKAVDRLLTTTLREWKIPGAAVAIVQNDRVVYVQGYGTKALGATTSPVTADTLFQIASTSKAFTTTAMAMLADEGKLSFDDPVRKHVEYFRLADVCADSQITLRDIVSHRTGLPRRDELWDDTTLSREAVIRSMGHLELARPFRTGYGYHNIMFITAGEAVASAAGMPWDDFVRTRIFQPLGMTRTITSDAEWIRSDHATGHTYDWKSGNLREQPPIDTATLGAGGAIKSSARDLANWIRFHLAGGVFDGKRLAGEATLAETKTPHSIIRMQGLTRELNPETHLMTYGMAWFIQDYRGEQLVAHSGSLNGFRTQVALLPKRNAGFVILINSDRGLAPVALRNALADMLTGKPQRDWSREYLTIDRTADEKDEKDHQALLAKRIEGTSPTRALAGYTGRYTSPAYGAATIALVDGGLLLQWERWRLPLSHFHYDVFRTDSEAHSIQEAVTFTLDDEKKVNGLTFYGERFAKK